MKTGKTAEIRHAATLGISQGRAATVGATVKTKIERGDRYSAPEVYSLEITVCEVLRGKGARERLKTKGISKSMTKTGFEPVLVRIRFGYFSKGRGFGYRTEPYKITEGCFVAVSPDGKTEYEIPAMRRQPQPALLNTPFFPGDMKEGWIVLQAPEGAEDLFLIFNRDYRENIYGFWGPVWFRFFPLRPWKDM
jgi:hypothetical protein